MRGLPTGLQKPNVAINFFHRALLLLGFAGAFRRSELVALDVADIAETSNGLLVTIRRSKTDQDGEGVVARLFDCKPPDRAFVPGLPEDQTCAATLETQSP
jgi:integrase